MHSCKNTRAQQNNTHTQTATNPNLGSAFAIMDYFTLVEVVFVTVHTVQEWIAANGEKQALPHPDEYMQTTVGEIRTRAASHKLSIIVNILVIVSMHYISI